MSDFQAIADRVEIEALRGEFTDAAMMRDYDRVASLFTPDGALRMPDVPVELAGRVAAGLAGPSFRCSCRSRKIPGKRALDTARLRQRRGALPRGAFPHVTDIGRARGYARSDAFLLGRRTYELFAEYWSQVTDPATRGQPRLKALPKYVVSTTLDRVQWNNSILLRGDVADEVAKLKRQPGNELQVHGSAALVRTLVEHGLVDEYRLLIHPVVLGNGKRLFAGRTTPAALELIGTKTTSRGVVAHIYRPSGKPEYGSAAPEQEGEVVQGRAARTSP